MPPRSGMPPQYPPYTDMSMMYSQQFAGQSKSMPENDLMMTMKSQNIAIKPNAVPGMVSQSIPMNEFNPMFKLNQSRDSTAQNVQIPSPKQDAFNQYMYINNISPSMAPPGLEVRSNSQKLKQMSNDSLSSQLRSKQNTKSQSSK